MPTNDPTNALRDKYFGRSKTSSKSTGPEFRAREEKFPLLGATGRVLQSVDEFARKPFGYENPPAAIISDLMQIPALTRTIENINYGSPLTYGTGQARKLTKDTKGAAEAALNLAPGAGPLVRATKNLPVGLTIRPRGSQTVDIGLKGDLRGFYRRADPEGTLADLEARFAGEAASPQAALTFENARDALKQEVAIKKWIEGPLAKYIKRDMGTPEDPVRMLAEEGITHTKLPEYFDQPTFYQRRIREKAGFPGEGLGKSPEARRYETAADYAVDEPFIVGRPETAEIFNLAGNPVPDWMQKLPEGTKVFAPRTRNLGFEHIIDVLKEDLATGRIRPDQLSKVSMEQAVRRTHEYNLEKAAAMEKAAVEETGKYFPIHREYPGGFRWVELKANPAKSPDELTANAKVKYDRAISAGADEKTALEHANEYHIEELTGKALKNEGEIMGHCVGGYCEDVISGSTRIFSLRDPKGRSHVTVEVSQPDPEMYYDAAMDALAMERGTNLGNISSEDVWQRATDMANAQGGVGKIEQIKGKQNLAPIEEYQPYVADFVRQGQWNPDIGDLHYTDLVKFEDKYIRKPELDELYRSQGYDDTKSLFTGEGLTKEGAAEERAYHLENLSRTDPGSLSESDRQMFEKLMNFEYPGFASGGSVDLRTKYFGAPRTRSPEDAYKDIISRASTEFSTMLAGMRPPINNEVERPTLADFTPAQYDLLEPIEMIS